MFNNVSNELNHAYVQMANLVGQVVNNLPDNIENAVIRTREFLNDETTQNVALFALAAFAFFNPIPTIAGALVGRFFKQEINSALQDISNAWKGQDALIKVAIAAVAIGLATSLIASFSLSTLATVSYVGTGTYFGTKINY